VSKKKNIKLIKCFRAGSFPSMIMFSIGFTYAEIVKHLKKVKADEWLTGIENDGKLIDNNKYNALHREIVNTKSERPTKRLYYLIFTESFMFTDSSYSILAHEVLHITQFLLEPILNINNEYEAFAYTHTFIMNKCLKLIRNK